MEVDYNDIAFKVKKNGYKYLGRGSGRNVYDLGNGYVVKVAKNKKGIAQNEAEYNIDSSSETNIFAKIINASEEFKYIIMEKAEPIKKMKDIWNHFQVKNNKGLFQTKVLKDILSKHNLGIMDFGRASNWGTIKGNPVIVDYGLTNKVFKRYYLRENLIKLMFLGII